MSTNSVSSSKSAWLSAVLKTRKAATKKHHPLVDLPPQQRSIVRSRSRTRKSYPSKHFVSEDDPPHPSPPPPRSRKSRTIPSPKYVSSTEDSSDSTSDSSNANDRPRSPLTSPRTKNHSNPLSRHHQPIRMASSTNLYPTLEKFHTSRSASCSRISETKSHPVHCSTPEESSDTSNGDDDPRLPQTSRSPSRSRKSITKPSPTYHFSSDDSSDNSNNDDKPRTPQPSAQTTNHSISPSRVRTRIRKASGTHYVSSVSSYCANDDIESLSPTSNAQSIKPFPSKDIMKRSNYDENHSIADNSNDMFSCSTIDHYLLDCEQTTKQCTPRRYANDEIESRSPINNVLSIGSFPRIDTVNRANYIAAPDTRTLPEEDIITKLQDLNASLGNKVGKLQDLSSSLAFKTERDTHRAQPIKSYILRDTVKESSSSSICLDKNQSVEEDNITKLQDSNTSLASKVERRNKLIFGLEDDKRSAESMLQLKLARISELEDKLTETGKFQAPINVEEVEELETTQRPFVDQEISNNIVISHSDCLDIISASEATAIEDFISTDEESLQHTAIFAQKREDLTSSLEKFKATSGKLKRRVFELEFEARISHEKMLTLQDSIDFEETKRQIEDTSLIQSLRDQVTRISREKNVLKNIMEKQIGGKHVEITKLQESVKNLSQKISTMDKSHIYEIEELGRSHTNTVRELEDAIKREQLADIEQRSLSIEHLRKEISSLTSKQLSTESKYSKLLELSKEERSTAAQKIEKLSTHVKCIEKENSKVTATLSSKCAELEHSLEDANVASVAQKGIIIELELERNNHKKASSKYEEIEQELTRELTKTAAESKKLVGESHGLKTCIQELRAEKLDILTKHDQEKKIYKLVALDDINRVEAEKKVVISKYELKRENYEQEKLRTEKEISELNEELDEKETQLKSRLFSCT